VPNASVNSRTSWRRLALVAQVAVLAMPTAVGLMVAPSASGASEECSAVSSPPYIPAAATTTLTPANQRTTTPPEINLGTSRSVEPVAPYSFDVEGEAPELGKMSWETVLVYGNKPFPEDQVAVEFSAPVGGLRVKVCLDPAGVDAGSYSGTLTIAGNGVAPVQLPLTVNLKDGGLPVIWAGIVVAAIAAVFFKWWTLKLTDADETNLPNLKQFVKWARTQWITVLIAIGAAVGTVYATKFHNVEAFVPSDRWGLWAATFTAVTSASLLLNAIGLAAEPANNNGDQKTAV